MFSNYDETSNEEEYCPLEKRLKPLENEGSNDILPNNNRGKLIDGLNINVNYA